MPGETHLPEVYQFLANHDVLTKEQFGFRPGQSAKDQLLLTYDNIMKNLDPGHVTDLILFDDLCLWARRLYGTRDPP